MDDIISAKQACNYLGVSRATLDKGVRRGEIPGQKVVGQWRFSKRRLLAWIEGRKQAGEKLTEARQKELFDQFWRDYPEHMQKSHPEEALSVFQGEVTNTVIWERLEKASGKYRQAVQKAQHPVLEPARFLKQWRSWA